MTDGAVGRDPTGRDPVDDAILALLLEVAGTPKPGNVDRRRDLDGLHFESFLGGAIGAREGLERAARGAAVGDAFEHAVAGMADRAGTNTQFGCLLLLVPLLRATEERDADDTAASAVLSSEHVDEVTRRTTVDDAVAFYRAFEHVDVSVTDPPADAGDLDVRRGSDAEPALRERDATLRDVMALSAEVDGSDRVPDRNAREWVEGFPRTFRAADWISDDEGPLTDRAARAFVGLLAAEPDTLVGANHGPRTALDASRRAAALLDHGGAGTGADDAPVGDGDGIGDVDGVDDTSDVNHTDDVDDIDPAAVHGVDLDAAAELAAAFVDEGINPGTTADLTCAALYVALRRGAEVAP